jgi:vesicle coat complex subunit
LTFDFRPDILKNEMKVFFVKYNDPIYVKLEKLDIMIRLTNHSNIAQVLAELKEYVLSRLFSCVQFYYLLFSCASNRPNAYESSVNCALIMADNCFLQ